MNGDMHDNEVTIVMRVKLLGDDAKIQAKQIADEVKARLAEAEGTIGVGAGAVAGGTVSRQAAKPGLLPSVSKLLGVITASSGDYVRQFSDINPTAAIARGRVEAELMRERRGQAVVREPQMKAWADLEVTLSKMRQWWEWWDTFKANIQAGILKGINWLLERASDITDRSISWIKANITGPLWDTVRGWAGDTWAGRAMDWAKSLFETKKSKDDIATMFGSTSSATGPVTPQKRGIAGAIVMGNVGPSSGQTQTSVFAGPGPVDLNADINFSTNIVIQGKREVFEALQQIREKLLEAFDDYRTDVSLGRGYIEASLIGRVM